MGDPLTKASSQRDGSIYHWLFNGGHYTDTTELFSHYYVLLYTYFSSIWTRVGNMVDSIY